MPTLVTSTPTAYLNYSSAGTGPSRTRHIASYTSRRLRWNKGVDNLLDIYISGEDRKPVNLLGRTVVFTLWDNTDNKTIFRRRSSVSATETGRIRLVVEPQDLGRVQPGLYYLSATMVDADGYETLLTWDQAGQGNFTIEVCEEVMPASRVTEVIDTWTISDGLPISSAVSGPVARGSDYNLFTVAVYATNFTGTVKVQGTLDEVLDGVSTLWADLVAEDQTSASLAFNNYTGILPLNYTTSMRWIRTIRINGLNNAGSLDKILIRV